MASQPVLLLTNDTAVRSDVALGTSQIGFLAANVAHCGHATATHHLYGVASHRTVEVAVVLGATKRTLLGAVRRVVVRFCDARLLRLSPPGSSVSKLDLACETSLA